MDKIVEYQIQDMQNEENKISVTIKITTIGFPVEETLEYEQEGEWYEDITKISRKYEDLDLQNEWENFQSRLLSFLSDGNLRIILDIIDENDSYYNAKYNLKTDVLTAQIKDEPL